MNNFSRLSEDFRSPRKMFSFLSQIFWVYNENKNYNFDPLNVNVEILWLFDSPSHRDLFFTQLATLNYDFFSRSVCKRTKTGPRSAHRSKQLDQERKSTTFFWETTKILPNFACQNSEQTYSSATRIKQTILIYICHCKSFGIPGRCI